MMKQYDVVLFDLDGTLTDPGEGITNAVMYALEHMGLQVPAREQLYSFIGPPLSDSFARYFNLQGEENAHAIALYREYYRPYGVNENLLYDGVEEMLRQLCGRGKKLLLATSKPEVFAHQILETFHLKKYFSFIGGASLDGSRGEKAEVIAYALQSACVDSNENILMVGDRKYDVLGAKQHGLDSVGVLSGYGSQQELAEAGATYILDHIKNLPSLFL